MKIIRMLLLISMLCLPAAAAEEMPAVREKDGTNAAELRPLLNSFAALGEGYMEKVLRGLKVISATEEARSGEWEEMKEVLAEFAKGDIKSSAIWFVRPDGSYYTLEKGPTGENLNDRFYFPRLMEGKEISGELVLSKSTGKRSAIVAVPVKKNEIVIGGLGVSLDIEEISRMAG
jgi:hypothetical protein